MNRIWTLVAILILFSACSEHDYTGIYVSGKRSVFDYFYLHGNNIKAQITGSTLVLKPDSAFEFTTCGAIKTGTWKVKENKLLLFVTSNKFRIDSLNRTGYNGKFLAVPTKPLEYDIHSNSFTSIRLNEKGDNVLDLLVKK